MIKKICYICCLLIIGFAQAQTSYEFDVIEESAEVKAAMSTIDTNYVKTLEHSKERSFDKELNEKYSGSDFNYNDNIKESSPEPIKERKSSTTVNSGSGGSAAFSSFMSTIFPILLGIAVVLIIVKVFFNVEPGFWKSSIVKKEQVKKLISEDDNIDENDYEQLLQLAVRNRDFRLATRYYYLSLLKNLSQKKFIEYHKDKTNSEYMFELKDKQMRSAFSYLSYVYAYVWYGEFTVDEAKFATIEEKYQSFIKTIK
ncbi:hypothetical protein [Pseudotenacibaculum haliotis]|uniref:DUF4129 domain-containing protein n=1 Tax=Pseudotenacibaculum haliotis TaxID=1862138 RepID=A0ABW5LRP5_9FLAO